MGKRERHAAKELAKGRAALAGPKDPKAEKPLSGFKAGWGWGVKALAMFARHPLYLGVGHASMLAAALAAWGIGALWAQGVPFAGALFMLALAAGIPAAGSAARARAAAKPGKGAPWMAWLEGWTSWRAAGSSALRALASLALIGAISAACHFAQLAMFAKEGGQWALSWEGQASSLATLYAMAVWAPLSAAAPGASWRRWAMAGLRMAASPKSLIGFCLFWFGWIVLSGLASSWLFTVALGAMFEGPSGGPDLTRQMMAPLTAFAMLVFQAPIMAMSAGLAWEALDKAGQGEPPALPGQPAAAPEPGGEPAAEPSDGAR